MALRPIDNALPVTTQPEVLKKPKRQAKKVSSLATQNQVGGGGVVAVNDENRSPSLQHHEQPPAPDVAVDYIDSEKLLPLSDPDSTFQGLIEGLDSKDWVKVCESLNNARRFALFHSSLLLPILEKVMVVVVKAMKNPRSALCKTSIMASSDIFTAFGDNLLDLNTENGTSNAFDNLLLQLLLKASQDKRFVCEEADRALNALVKSMTALPLLRKLQAYVNHANLRVRAKVAVSISNSVSKMGLEDMRESGLVQLVQVAADLLNDRLPEAREAARNIVVSVYEAYTANQEQKQEIWQNFCQSNLPPTHAQSMIKITSPQQKQESVMNFSVCPS